MAIEINFLMFYSIGSSSLNFPFVNINDLTKYRLASNFGFLFSAKCFFQAAYWPSKSLECFLIVSSSIFLSEQAKSLKLDNYLVKLILTIVSSALFIDEIIFGSTSLF